MTSPPQEHPNGSPQEDPKSLRRWVTALLVLGIVAQTAVLFARSTDFVGIMSTPTPTPIMVGNQVSGIQARSDVDGFFRFIPISGRSFWPSIQNVFIATPSLLYGLSLAHNHPARVAAVTMEPLQAGRYYAKKHGWDVEVLTDTPGAGSIEAFLVSRTPWLFLFDPVGTLVYHGFGGDLEALDTWLDT